MEKKIVLAVLISEFADWEFALLAAGLRKGFGMWDNTCNVKTVSVTNGYVYSMGGLTVIPDYTLETAPIDFSALILVGGTNWFSEEGEKALPLIRTAFEKKTLIGAICDASIFLGAHGYLNDVNHTCAYLHEMKEKAGSAYTGETRYRTEQSVRDENIITAKPTGALEFARDIFIAMNLIPEEKVDLFYKVFKEGI